MKMVGLREIIWVGLGGFTGAVLRYLVSGWVQQWSGSSSFPYGTVGVNIIGCLLLGLLGGLSDQLEFLSSTARMFLMIGLLGGFTTFSTFSYESMMLLRDGAITAGFLNIGFQVFVGLFAVWIGYTITTFV